MRDTRVMQEASYNKFLTSFILRSQTIKQQKYFQIKNKKNLWGGREPTSRAIHKARKMKMKPLTSTYA